MSISIGAIGETRDWTPRDVEAQCLVPASYLEDLPPNTFKPYYTPELVILKWHIYGADTQNHLLWGENWKFEKECLSKEAKGRCGIPYNRKLARVVALRSSDKKRKAARAPGGIIHKLFSSPPPAEAIDFAQRGLGRCFGSDREMQVLPEPVMQPLNVSPADCSKAAGEIVRQNREAWTNIRGLTPPETQYVRGWIYATLNLNTRLKDPQNATICTSAPPMVAQQIERRLSSEQQQLAAQRAEEQRLASRTVEQRIAGLNGCQIAYSLVFNGLNASSTGYQPVGRIPDGAISWSLAYEQANLKNEACPAIPADLSDWVQNQPLRNFEAAKDPYTWFRQRTAPSAPTHAGWEHFVNIWMSRYQTQNVIVGNDVSVCQKVRHYMQTNRNLNRDPKSAFTAFWQLFRIVGNDEIGASLACSVTPPEIIGPAKSKWNADLRAQAKIADMAERRRKALEALELRLNPPRTQADNYLWPREVTTRCYRLGETKYGTRQICFTN